MPHFIPLAFWGLTTTTWVVMWVLLSTTTVLLLLLLRTRWSNKRTWQKCAILSLWVHVLLAVVAMTVRIVTGAPASGDQEPIRVAVVVEQPAAPQQSAESQSDNEWEQATAPPLIAPSDEPLPVEMDRPDAPDTPLEQLLAEVTPPSPAPPLEAPPLLASPVESKEAPVEKPTESPEPNSPPADSQNTPADSSSSASDVAATADATDDSRQQFPDVLPTGPPTPQHEAAIADTYADRFRQDLTAVAVERGGSEQTERAVRAALGWLAAAQSENGGWDASRFGAGQERIVLGHDRRGAGVNADTAVTGLALLAFLGTGNSHQHGTYRTEVARGLDYLRQHQRADGALYGEAALFARTYCHSMASLAVCEAYAMTRDSRLDSVARAATAYSLSLQHPTDGGWRYRRGDTGDTSQLGWQLMALKSAQLAGIEIPRVTWTRVDRFLRRVRRGSEGGLAAYRHDGPASRTMTAEAWFCHQLLHDGGSDNFSPSAREEALDSLLRELPTANSRNLYYWYYATLALQQNQQQSEDSQDAWQTWNHALTTALLSTQQHDGSWNEATTWGGYGGRVYTTAISALCLEVYYRYKPPHPPGVVAEREQWRSMK